MKYLGVFRLFSAPLKEVYTCTPHETATGVFLGKATILGHITNCLAEVNVQVVFLDLTDVLAQFSLIL